MKSLTDLNCKLSLHSEISVLRSSFVYLRFMKLANWLCGTHSLLSLDVTHLYQSLSNGHQKGVQDTMEDYPKCKPEQLFVSNKLLDISLVRYWKIILLLLLLLC